MAAKKPAGARSETVRCENCGEYYAVTYKHCPFCEEQEDTRRLHRRDIRDDAEDYDADEEYEYEDEDCDPRSRGGKRLSTNTRGGGYGHGPSPWRIVGIILSLSLIAVAVYIVITGILPLIKKGDSGTAASPTPIVSSSPGASAAPSTSPGPGDPSVSPSPDISPAPDGQRAASFSLSGNGDLTVNSTWPTYQFVVTFSPSGSSGSITWESDKPEVVSVSESGLVRGLSKGTATITATMADGYSQKCIVRSQVSGSAATSPAPSGGGSSSLSISRKDFTLSKAGDRWQLKVTGASGAITWSIKNTAVATVSADGTVTAVGKGTTTVTASADGKTLTCIVRCSW